MESEFYTWKSIDVVRTELRGSGKQSAWFLKISLKENNKSVVFDNEINISDLDLSPKKIQRHVNLHRQRNRLKSASLNK